MIATMPAPEDRRRYPRQKLPTGLKVELRVEVSGVNPAVLLTHGEATDISRGGMVLAIDLAVPVGTHVDVRFPSVPSWVHMTPHVMSGRVVRAESLGGVPGRLAVAFSEPLVQLEVGLRERLRKPSRPAGRYRPPDADRVVYAAEAPGLH